MMFFVVGFGSDLFAAGISDGGGEGVGFDQDSVREDSNEQERGYE